MLDILLKNAKLAHQEDLIDVAVDKKKIVALESNISSEAEQTIDLEGRLLLPGFVDSHVHLDIALMNSWDEPGRQYSCMKLLLRFYAFCALTAHSDWNTSNPSAPPTAWSDSTGK